MILNIVKEQDINVLMVKAKAYFIENGISEIISVELTTIISELGYNIIKYTPKGTMSFYIENNDIVVIASDKGSGIQNITSAISDGYSSSGTLGLGISGIIRLSDEFDVETSSLGTTITIRKTIG